jgi:hypothetical protein
MDGVKKLGSKRRCLQTRLAKLKSPDLMIETGAFFFDNVLPYGAPLIV